jgi:D-alanyl-D-alanine carboxypeptidase
MHPLTPNQFNLETKRLIRLGALLILVLALATVISFYLSRGVRTYDSGPLVEENLPNPFDTVSLVARSAIVYDIQENQILFSKNINDVLPLASITKVLSAITAVELLPPDSVIAVRAEFLNEEGDSGLYRDEEWSLQELIDFSLLTSSNDGMAAIASAAGALRKETRNPEAISREEFIVAMNEKAKAIGMTESSFFNESGLDIPEGGSGGYSSAYDIARLFAYTLRAHPAVLEATRYDNLTLNSLSEIGHLAQNTNVSLNAIPGVIASKTGFTDLAGGNLAIVFDPGLNRPIVVVVLGSTYDSRFTDVETLVTKTFESISQER